LCAVPFELQSRPKQLAMYTFMELGVDSLRSDADSQQTPTGPADHTLDNVLSHGTCVRLHVITESHTVRKERQRCDFELGWAHLPRPQLLSFSRHSVIAQVNLNDE